ncbi:lytic murein transglycosylase [Bauldia litoralis]|uniref:lytic murein transglycosylase n=1 Tax=Bauldia litoralis TaxID=665467 RepID=UPI0032641B32
MTKFLKSVVLSCAVLAFAGAASDAYAARCGNNSAGFSRWLNDFKGEAVRAGISQKVVNSALQGVTYDASVIKLDRNQKHFKLSFEKFYASRGAPLQGIAKSRYQQNRKLLDGIERRYGVPGQVVVAIWGLETSFGANTGNKSSIRSLATLAYDCRRSDFFTNELMAALQIVQRGDMAPSQMIGAWAGELGQTQFLATSYLKFAVDYDGNGRRDLIRSKPDALASTANYLKAYGWKAGQSYQPGTHNYAVLGKWNKATVYQQTIAVLAGKIGG